MIEPGACEQPKRGEGVVVVGTAETLERVAALAMASGVVRPRLLGAVLVEGDTASTEAGAHAAWAGGATVLGTERDLRAIVAAGSVDLAVVCLPAAMTALVARVEGLLHTLGVEVRRLPTIEDTVLGHTAAASGRLDLHALVGREPRRIDTGLTERLIRGQRIMITGAGGSIGSELARLCADHKPAELILVERAENALFEIDRCLAERHPAVPRRAVLHDIVHADETRRRLEALRPDAVFHAAAHKHVPLMQDHPAEALRNNLFGTVSVADAAAAAGAQRFVLVSTDKAVHPRSVMGATKQLAERYVRSLDTRLAASNDAPMRCAVVRFGNVLGSASSVLPIWSSQLADGGPMTITDARMTRYFMTIPEAASLVVQAAALTHNDNRTRPAADVFVLDMGEPVHIVDLARRFARAHGVTALLPGEVSNGAWGGGPCVRIRLTGTRPGEKLHEQLAHDPTALRSTRVPGVNRWPADALPPDAAAQLVERLRPLCDEHEAGAVIAAIAHEVPDLYRTEAAAFGIGPPAAARAA